MLNKTLGSNFDPLGFDHVALWDAENSWIEMRLRANRTQTVAIPGLDQELTFAAGDELRTEISTKFTVESMTDELWQYGFVVEHAWPDEAHDFALLLARPYC